MTQPQARTETPTPPVDVSNDLLGELQKIGLELSSTMKTTSSPSQSPWPPAHRQLAAASPRSASPAFSGTIDPDRIQALADRVSIMERQVVALKREAAAHDSARRKAQSEARAARRKEEETKKLLKDAQEENDIIFDTFNGHLKQLAQGIQGSRGKEELENVLEALRKEQARLVKENM